MSTAFFPTNMRSMPSGGRNHNSTYENIPYISWKGTGVFSNPVGIASTHIRPLTNNDTGNVIGFQNKNGKVDSLTDETIELCKKYKFTYKLPENLNVNKGLSSVKVEDLDDEDEDELDEDDIEEEEEELDNEVDLEED